MRYLFGEHVVDLSRRELRRHGEFVAIEPQVFDLLVYLLHNRDRVVSKDDLIDAIWEGRIVAESTLTSRINAVRKAIADDGEGQRFVRTYARKGFRFVGEVTQLGNAPTIASEDTDPSPLVTRTESGRSMATASGKPTLAVLPFMNLNGDPEQEYFSDGVTEDIITALSRHRSLELEEE